MHIGILLGLLTPVTVAAEPTGAQNTVESTYTGSSGKYYAAEDAACSAARVDGLSLGKQSCKRDGGRVVKGDIGECTCEQGGFEGSEWLCSVPVNVICLLTGEPNEKPEEGAEPPADLPPQGKLDIVPPTSQEPLEIASYAFKRRGESLPVPVLEDRFKEACQNGWEFACGAPKWITGKRYDLRKAAPDAERTCKKGDTASCIVQGWTLEDKATQTNDGKYFREAAKIYKGLCDGSKNARACYEYGTILFNNLGVTADPSLGIKRWTEACELGEGSACTVLGKIHRMGLKTPADPEKALRFADKACLNGDAAGCLQKAYLGGNKDAIIQARIDYCVRGGTDECWEMATSYTSGRAIEPREGLARRLLAAGCELAHAPACANAAKLFLDAGDHEDAAQLYRAGCELGDVRACTGISQMILSDRAEGSILDESYAFEVACSRGEYAEACAALGMGLLEANRADDRPRARALLRQSCTDEKSPARTCFTLGEMYEQGHGGERDRTLAARYYRWACDGGWGEACQRAGELYDEGVGVREDDNEAVALFAVACESGIADSCYRAGVILDEGTNVDRDAERALGLYAQGCDGSIGDACERLARLNLEGIGSGRDEAAARKNFERAVDNGNVIAHRKLAWMLWNGIGGKKDKKRAKVLCAEGCQHDDSVACRGPAFQTEDL